METRSSDLKALLFLLVWVQRSERIRMIPNLCGENHDGRCRPVGELHGHHYKTTWSRRLVGVDNSWTTALHMKKRISPVNIKMISIGLATIPDHCAVAQTAAWFQMRSIRADKSQGRIVSMADS